jgi:hypothetical protein
LFAPGGGDDWVTIRVSEYNDLLQCKERVEHLLLIVENLEQTCTKNHHELLFAKERYERECAELKTKCEEAVVLHAQKMKVRFDDMFKQYSTDIVKTREQHATNMTKAADQYDHSTMLLKREIRDLREKIEDLENKRVTANPIRDTIRDWFGSPKHTDTLHVGHNTTVFNMDVDDKRVEPRSESSYETCNSNGVKARLNRVLNRYSGGNDKPVVSEGTSSNKTITYQEPPSLAGSGFSGTPYNPLRHELVGDSSLSGLTGVSSHQQNEPL